MKVGVLLGNPTFRGIAPTAQQPSYFSGYVVVVYARRFAPAGRGVRLKRSKWFLADGAAVVLQLKQQSVVLQ